MKGVAFEKMQESLMRSSDLVQLLRYSAIAAFCAMQLVAQNEYGSGKSGCRRNGNQLHHQDAGQVSNFRRRTGFAMTSNVRPYLTLGAAENRRFDLQLAPTGAGTGRVIDEKGDPLESASVSAEGSGPARTPRRT
jgi:hypothetical protein